MLAGLSKCDMRRMPGCCANAGMLMAQRASRPTRNDRTVVKAARGRFIAVYLLGFLSQRSMAKPRLQRATSR
jgi:hypothetical protein